MAEKKRQCGTCRFFLESDSGGHGKCSHPGRDRALREMVLLCPNELGCRTRWGTSLWQDPDDESEPTTPDVPQQPVLPEPIVAQMHYDDEVTSVSIAGSTSTRPSLDDDVVDSGAVVTRRGSWNDPLQDERRRLLMHSDRDALAGARKRHMEKQSRQRELIPFADETGALPPAESPEAEPTPVRETEASAKPAFPPDDYVEEERASETGDPVPDDALVDTGVRPGDNRSPRSRRLMRETKSPKGRKAMDLGLPAEINVTANNPEQREQWNSVPTVTPGFDLPLMNGPAPRPSTPLRMSASAAPMVNTPLPSRPVSQARELMSEDRLRHECARRHVDVPLADDQAPLMQDSPAVAAVTDRPRLSQAPGQQAAPVERLKSSPLRGYHPAVKGTARAPREQVHRPDPQQASAPTITTPRVQSAAPPRRLSPSHPVAPSPGRQQEAATAPVRREHGHTEQPERRPLVPVRDTTPFRRDPITIAPEVTRRCGTCTSFRPGGIEGRGSCTNAFAGPAQRVVHADDLACQHTYGSLWLPADEEVWLEELQLHNGDTPRVDRMIARRTQAADPVLPDLEELTS